MHVDRYTTLQCMGPRFTTFRPSVDDVANSMLANVWKRKMEERMAAKAALKAAQKRLRTNWVDVSCQTDARKPDGITEMV